MKTKTQPITLDRSKNKELIEFFEIIEFYMRRFETINRCEEVPSSKNKKYDSILINLYNQIHGSTRDKLVGIDYDSPNVKTSIKNQVVIQLEGDVVIFKISVKVSNPNSNSEAEFPFTLSSNGEIFDYDEKKVKGTAPLVGLYWSLMEHLIDHQKEFTKIYEYFNAEIITELRDAVITETLNENN